MTQKEKQIKIAKACGWTMPHQKPFGKPSDFISRIEPDGSWFDGPLPDYLNDLNAMHEAEKVLNYKQCAEYAEILFRIKPDAIISASSEGYHDFDGYFTLINATASQRAEAFLITLDLWG